MDIGAFISQFIGSILSIFSQCFGMLDSISFNGISLLTYIISVQVMLIVLPLLLTLTKTKGVRGKSNARKESKSNED